MRNAFCATFLNISPTVSVVEADHPKPVWVEPLYSAT